jgi:hypothetical protein
VPTACTSPETPYERYELAMLATPIRYISFEREAPEIDVTEFKNILIFGYVLCDMAQLVKKAEEEDVWEVVIAYAKRKEFRRWLERVIEVAYECAEEAEHSEEEHWE